MQLIQVKIRFPVHLLAHRRHRPVQQLGHILVAQALGPQGSFQPLIRVVTCSVFAHTASSFLFSGAARFVVFTAPGCFRRQHCRTRPMRLRQGLLRQRRRENNF
nr:MAG TPA_asm: hypothetical protein [Bacteriophage sp.]